MPPAFAEIGDAFVWGAVCAVGLVVGAVAGSFTRLSHHMIALAMVLGAAPLLAAASLDLATEAIRTAGHARAVSSLLLGAAAFSATNAILARFGARHRKRCGECTQQPSESQQPGSGVALAVGTVLDAVPEALVLGLALAAPTAPLGLVIAISVANLPGALSGASGMRAAGRSHRYILVLWCTLALGLALATTAARAAFASLGPSWSPHLLAIGAGALLAMAAETMLPEAFHNSPRFSGFLAAVGFCVRLVVGAATR